eukprot:CAMPEP_0118661012 /NCGR_PEP_ID=MMETSP0785-20121206/16027_1 /TAXON_ID=91992 /ORGANISM="Bolidomonas pacifica, Strain CCMP 1866" /LENGTH=332 /DNA_ID=CAMNT_0006554373 /DNA_START=135 /DNA_END=1130 /DNA_ORIENTATION=+
MPSKAFPYDKPLRSSYPRMSTPSDNSGGMTKAVFNSTSKRFKYHGRQAPNEKAFTPPKSKSTESKPARLINNDTRSEVIIGMTFARAMGLDDTVHSPQGQDRSLSKPVLLDYEPYDWRAVEEKRRKAKGFAIDKVGRRDGRFYGSSWRGCAALVPTNLADVPTSYIGVKDMVGEMKTSLVKTSLESKAPARGSLDSLRLGLLTIPKAKAACSTKLGPGHYNSHAAREKSKSRGGILNDVQKESSAFKAPSRRDRMGDRLDVFRKANVRLKEEREKEEIIKKKKDDDSNPYSMYQNFTPSESLKFLAEIQSDDNFHFLLKRIEEGKQTDEERN